MKIKHIFLILLIAGITVTQSFAAGNPPQVLPPQPETDETVPSPIALPILSPILSWGPNTIPDIVEKVGDAVVNIDVVKNIRVSSPFKNFEREFGSFGFEFMPGFRDQFRDRIIPQKGAGSGFIIDQKGHILTNAHVVSGADEIKVTLKDGRKFDGKIIGQDSALDLAILKIEGTKLPSLKLGDSSKIRPGEWVIAIGNPYGFANTVTVGIISATGRSLGNLGKKNLIQTDTPINPGNSGGPLLNLNGEVIGINVAIVSGAQSIGFSIPINSAKEVIDQLIKEGKVIRAWLGVYMKDVDEKLANYLDLPIAEGVVVVEIIKDSPAEKMGLLKYDIIKSINEEKVKSSQEITEKIQKMKPNDRITIKVYREGKNKILKGKLKERP